MKRPLLSLLLIFACLQVSSGAPTSDVPYGSDPYQRLDVYSAADARAAPIVLMVHGGGWRRGDKRSQGVVGHKAQRWMSRGLILVSVNYRMLPDADPLEQANDVAQALAFVQSHAAQWGGDPNRVILMGHSAGAHLVALLTADPSLAARAGARRWLGTVSIDSGAIDVPAIMQQRHLPLYDHAFGRDAKFWEAASPVHVLSTQALPLLEICSTRRPDHPCRQAHAYADRAAALHVRAEILEQPLSHMDINGDLGLDSEYTRAVEAFMASLDTTVAARLADH